MSGTAPQDDGQDSNAVLAGEFVLGLLSVEEQARVEILARQDKALAAAIAQWQARLDPLSDLPEPMPASPELWARIEASLAPQAAAAPSPARKPANDNFWRALALAGMAAAAVLAAFIWQAPPKPEPWAQAVALLTAPGSIEAGLRAQVTRGGTITVVPLHAVTLAQGRKLGFWAWPKGQPAPVLLGMITPSGGQLRFPFPVQDATPVMVTDEPPEGPGAKPGATLFIGLLALTG